MSVVDTFLEIVQIDSLSLEEDKIAQYVVKYLKKLDFEVEVDAAGLSIGGNSGNIIAKLSSTISSPTILFNAHLDTVEPGKGVKPHIDNGIIRSDGTTVLGSDNKAGIAIILEAMRLIVENNLPHGPIEVVFTVAEEIGLLGSKNLQFDQLKADLAFVLDAEGDAGGIIVKAPSQNSLKVVFTGQSAHAGVNPERGINSIEAAAKAISYMKLGRIDFETTVNMGVIKGGLAPNIVPPKTTVEGEVRSHSKKKLIEQTEKIVKCVEKGAAEIGATVDINISTAFEAFSLNENDEIVRLAIAAIKTAELEPRLQASGGGSDANIINRSGIPAVNLSVGEDRVHSTNETISINNLENGVKILLNIVSEAIKGKK